MDKAKLPKHIAIIMDGNGRWAQERNLRRTEGHLEGVKRVEEIVEEAAKIGIGALTLYTFSTENWTRPQTEVSMLMSTLVSVLNKKIEKLKSNNVRFQFIGRKDHVSEAVLNTFNMAIEKTKENTGLILNLAFNYGSRAEIIDATKAICEDVQAGRLGVGDINEEVFSNALYTKDLVDPDLLIRTSGEQRISNFLLWQLSYAEFYFTSKRWPEFTKEELYKAIENYQNRERRFGNLAAK